MQDTWLSYQPGMPSLLKLPERQLPALLQPELRHYRLETHACALSFCCRPFLIQPLGILLISVILSLVIKPTSSRYRVQIIGLATALTRIIHEASTAAADPGMPAVLRSVGFLDVLWSTPAESSLRAPCIHARLRRLATNLHE